MSKVTPEQLAQINPYGVGLFSTRSDAFEWMTLCNEVQIELEQHLKLAQHGDADLFPSFTAQLIQQVQAHCLECFRMEKTLQDEIEHQESESPASSNAAAAA